MSARVLLAAALLAIGIGAPAALLGVRGSAAVDREGDRLRRQHLDDLAGRRERSAARLQERLDSLRALEALRPFYHYRPKYRDPLNAPVEDPWVVSPLASGMSDALIAAHFQVEPDGTVHVLPQGSEARRLVRRHAGALRESVGVPAPLTGQEVPWPAAVLDARTWVSALAGGPLVPLLERAAAVRSDVEKADPNLPQTTVGVGPLRWHRVPSDPRALLVAARYLLAPSGKYAQGFIVDLSVAEDWLGSSHRPVRLSLDGPAHEHAALDDGVADGRPRVHLDEVVLGVRIDAAPDREAVEGQAAFLRRDFEKTFVLGLALAVVSSFGLVGLLWHVERLAADRARLAAVAAHELRTPLAGLRLHAEMFAEGLGDPDGSRERARRIVGEVERLSRVVDNVLGYTRLERGWLAVAPEPGDLVQVVHDVLRVQEPLLDAAGVRVTLDLPASLPAAVFDRDAAAGILQNLVDNATKHAAGDGASSIEIRAVATGGTVRLSVRDHGPGIPPAVRRGRVRGGRRSAGETDGLGLGLALSRELAAAQGGALTVGDADGGGAVVTLSLPLADA